MKMFVWDYPYFTCSGKGSLVVIANNLEEAKKIAVSGKTIEDFDNIDTSMSYVIDRRRKHIKEIVKRQPLIEVDVSDGVVFGVYGSA